MQGEGHIHIIINPSSGKDAPILNILNRVFRERGVQWQIDITQNAGDADRMARTAVSDGAAVVAGYGGDGTLMEIANGLAGSDVPLGVLPGGTGNGIARELGIPAELEKAAVLLCEDSTVRRIDLGHVHQKYFLLHAYIGLDRSKRATRDMKDRFGLLAYVVSTLQLLADPEPAHYAFEVDGEPFERDGILCLATNAFSLGFNLLKEADIRPDNQLLNLIVVNQQALSFLSEGLNTNDFGKLIEVWQGQEIVMRSEPSLPIWIDGEDGGETPCTIRVVPEALGVVVPE